MDPEAVSIRPFAPTDAPWLIAANVAHYAASDGFDATFEEIVAEVVHGFSAMRDTETERGWIAEHRGQPVGSIFCVRDREPDVARLKLFFLIEEARGLGLGQRLLETCMEFARARRATKLILRTHESHRAAGQLYLKNGFRLVQSVPRRSFGVDVVEQHFEHDLT